MGVCANPESVISHIISHHARARRGLETSIAIDDDVWGIVLLSSRQKVARHDKRFIMQLPVNLSWVGGPHIKTLVGVSQGYARLCSLAFRVRHSYHLWKVAVRGTGVCSVGRPPDRPQCMGVCLKSFSVRRSYPDTHLFGILRTSMQSRAAINHVLQPWRAARAIRGHVE
jgi:hypothetical protein